MFRRMVYSLLALFIATAAIAPLGPIHSSSALADPIITGSKPYTFTPGTTISSSQVNANFDYIINQTNTNAAKNGVNTSITALLGLTTPINQVSGGSPIFTATTVGGTANAITVTATTPAISSYSLTKGNIVSLQVTANNTGAVTLNVNSLGAITVFKPTTGGLANLTAGDFVTNQVYQIYYDGANYIYLGTAPLFGQSVSLASAATVDLGSAASHWIKITGTTTITSFGTSATNTAPVYLVRMEGNFTIVASGNLLTPSGSSITVQSGDMALLEYAGSNIWRINAYWPINIIPSLETVNNLVINNNAGTPNTQIDVAASSSILCTTQAYCVRTGAVSSTINAATNGVNGLDTGSLANNTWYYIYLITSGQGASVGTLLSTSSSSPVLPAGILFKYRVGAIRTGGSATFNRIIQRGKKARYVVVTGSVTPNLPILFNGASGNVNTPTWTSIAVQNATLPATATEIDFIVTTSSSSGSQVVIMAPNNNYGPFASLTNPPAFATQMQNDGGIHNQQGNFVLESANIFYASTGASAPCAIMGWTDAVNAN